MKNKILVIACLVLVLCVSLVLPITTAFADYENDILKNPESIVNFNQYVSNEYTHNATLSSSYTNIAQSNFTGGHKFYIKLTIPTENTVYYELRFRQADNTNSQNVFSGNRNTSYENIVTLNLNYNYIYLSVYAYSSFNLTNAALIDLTQMFGAGNEPNLQQCQDLFVSEYYAYNTGSAVSINGLNAYANGYTDAVKFADIISASSEDFYNTAQSFYTMLPNNQVWASRIVKYNNNWLQIYGSYVDENDEVQSADMNVFQIPLINPIVGGTQCTFTYKCYNEAGAGSNPRNYFNIYLLREDGTFMNVVQSPKFASSVSSASTSITFDAPFSFNTIYIGTPYLEAVYFKDCVLTYRYYDFKRVETEQYKRGYKDASEYYDNLYRENGTLYNAIYYKGYYDYENAEHFTFRSLITSAVDVPVQAMTNLFDFDILGVNMKTFYLSVFTLCVIFVVLRLVL